MSPTLNMGERSHLQRVVWTSVSCNLPVRSTVTPASRLQLLLAVGHGTSMSSVSRKMLSGALLCSLNDGIVEALSTELIAQLPTCKHLGTICPLEVLPFCQHLFTMSWHSLLVLKGRYVYISAALPLGQGAYFSEKNPVTQALSTDQVLTFEGPFHVFAYHFI